MSNNSFDTLLHDIRQCRICIDTPLKTPLMHEPRPVLMVSKTAKICIAGQAPGTRVHASGKPFTDASGVRLRNWLNLDESQFYDDSKVAVVPMGFCFPGQNARGSDLPPRKECRNNWHDDLFATMPQIELMLVIGQYAMNYHLGGSMKANLTDTVSAWREYWYAPLEPEKPRIMPLPHPSWRNNSWLKKNTWFEQDVIPVLRQEIARLT
ncbi:MAG: uracil-DNA glycosylase family protein [Hyphomicrobiales bacterium]